MIEYIDMFLFDLHFVTIHSIHNFIQQQDVQKLGTIKLVVIRIYGKSSKSFILIVVNDLRLNDTQVPSFFLEFYPQYV
jgi:hypothetical protein